MFTVPVPNPTILAERVPVLPVALVNTPLAAIALEEAVVVKLCELDAQTPLGSAELLARTR